MENLIVPILGCLMLCSAESVQEPLRELKSGGHLLGETAQQFFSEGAVGELLRACEARDWKSVRQLAKAVDQTLKPNTKDICAKALLLKQQALGGSRQEHPGGDKETMRTDTFTLDGGRLVRIDVVYSTPHADVEGYHSKSYAELFAGLREAYGEPSKSYSETVLDTYGAKYEARRAVWMGKLDVISIIEQPGVNARIEIIAETVAEHNRAAQAPKATNPLQ